MTSDASSFMSLVGAISHGDADAVERLLAASPGLVAERAEHDVLLDEIEHYLYGGDTALHIAAAAYGHALVRRLTAAGADVRARNRRGAGALHYAADGVPGGRHWNPQAQAETIACLIEAGADVQAPDNSGVMPLHRAVRTRCAAAVSALLVGGADPRRLNKNGSTPLDLATRATGRGGSGSAEAKAQQAQIIKLLRDYGA